MQRPLGLLQRLHPLGAPAAGQVKRAVDSKSVSSQRTPSGSRLVRSSVFVLVPMVGVEPTTSFLPRKCTATVLHRLSCLKHLGETRCFRQPLPRERRHVLLPGLPAPDALSGSHSVNVVVSSYWFLRFSDHAGRAVFPVTLRAIESSSGPSSTDRQRGQFLYFVLGTRQVYKRPAQSINLLVVDLPGIEPGSCTRFTFRSRS